MTQCHLCETDLATAIIVNTIARHDEPQVSVACSRCGLVQATPLPREAELEAYYRDEYRAKFPWSPVQGEDGQMHERGSPTYERLMDAASAVYAKHIVETLGLDPYRDAVWELGCGDGRLLAAMQSLGFDSIGIEADPEMRSESRARGIPTADRPLEGVCREVFISVHSLEHFRDPLATLAMMRLHLRPSGKIWLEVPNLSAPYGPLTHFFQRPHLYNFTADTLAALLVRAGFDDIRVTESGHVLYAHATHGEREACGYDDAVKHMGRLPAGAEVAAMLAEYTRQRTRSPGARLNAWLEARGDDQDWLRDEFTLMGDALMVTMQSLGKMAEDLDALITEDSWHADPWVLAYRCGGKEMAQRAQVTVTHLANSLVSRATR